MYSKSTFSLLLVSQLFFIGSSLPHRSVRQIEANEDWENSDILAGESEEGMTMLQGLRQDVKNKGCGINLCFVMDGSDAVGDTEFTFQKNFIDIVMAITSTDRPGTYCAVQYHSSFSEITPLIDDREEFLRKVHDAKKLSGEGNITPGLRYAITQMVKQRRAANKIVLFSRKKPFISRALPSVLLRFFNLDGAICAVALNPHNRLRLIQNVTGDPNLVFPRDSFFEVSEVIYDLVYNLCEMTEN